MTTFFQRSFALSLVSLALGAATAGCGFLKKGSAEAGVEQEAAVVETVDAAPPPSAGPVASNEDDVARFPDEKKIENAATTVQRLTNVRDIPNIGKVSATLNKGGTVTQIAQRDKFFLVVFENPKDQKRLMGWVNQDSFTAAPAADAGIKALTCTAPEVPLTSDGPFCGKVCAADTDCPTGQACKGAANKFTNNKVGDAVTVCTVFTAPVKAVDGGAGKLGLSTPVFVPPVPVVIPIPNADVSEPGGGKCPVGFSLVAKDNKCHKNCVIGQCRKETTFCIKCGTAQVCSGNRELCK